MEYRVRSKHEHLCTSQISPNLSQHATHELLSHQQPLQPLEDES